MPLRREDGTRFLRTEQEILTPEEKGRVCERYVAAGFHGEESKGVLTFLRNGIIAILERERDGTGISMTNMELEKLRKGASSISLSHLQKYTNFVKLELVCVCASCMRSATHTSCWVAPRASCYSVVSDPAAVVCTDLECCGRRLGSTARGGTSRVLRGGASSALGRSNGVEWPTKRRTKVNRRRA